jgi:hypothetical protein
LLIILRISGAVAPKRRIMEKRAGKQLLVARRTAITERRFGFLIPGYLVDLGLGCDCTIKRA